MKTSQNQSHNPHKKPLLTPHFFRFVLGFLLILTASVGVLVATWYYSGSGTQTETASVRSSTSTSTPSPSAAPAADETAK